MDSVHLTTAHSSTDVRIFEKEAVSLADAGFDVRIIAHDAPNEPMDGVTFSSLGSASSRTDRWSNIPKAAQMAKSADAKVYHFHDPELLPVGVYLSQATDSAVVYDVHEDFGRVVQMRDWIPNWAGGGLAQLVPWTERSAAKQFDAVVSASDRFGEPFENTTDVVQTIHNFPRTNSISPTPTNRETNADCTLCYVGGLIEVRGIHRMLQLLDALVASGIDAELWALGPWTSNTNQAAAEEFIDEQNISDRVSFPGYVEYRDIFSYLKSADIGLALLDTEFYHPGKIPTKLFEYLYAGLPIVTTPIEAASQFVPPEYRYMVPQDDTGAAVEAVRRALSRDHDAEAMREVVEKQYSWEREAEKLINLYETLLE